MDSREVTVGQFGAKPRTWGETKDLVHSQALLGWGETGEPGVRSCRLCGLRAGDGLGYLSPGGGRGLLGEHKGSGHLFACQASPTQTAVFFEANGLLPTLELNANTAS